MSLVFLVILFALFATISAVLVNATQRVALNSFLNNLGCQASFCVNAAMSSFDCPAFNGDFFQLPNGIGCNAAGDVTSINIDSSSVRLSGSINGPLLGQLTNLLYLTATQNGIFGGLPEQIGLLTALKSIFLFSNPIGGTIPTTIGNCKALVHMGLSNTSLAGTVSIC